MWKNGRTAETTWSSVIVLGRAELEQVRDEVAVRQHDALRQTGVPLE